MAQSVLPDPSTPFGERVLRRLREEQVIFDGDGTGGDIVVFAGIASLATDVPLPHENPAYLAKYGKDAARAFGGVEKFSEVFRTPLRIEITRTRGR